MSTPPPANREPQSTKSSSMTTLDIIMRSYELPNARQLFVVNDMVPSKPLLSTPPVERYGFPSQYRLDNTDTYDHSIKIQPHYPAGKPQYPPPQHRQKYSLRSRLPRNSKFFEQAQHQPHSPTEPLYLQKRNSQPTLTSPSRSEQQQHDVSLPYDDSSLPQLPPFEEYPSQHPQCSDSVISGDLIYPAIFEERQDGTQAQVPVFGDSAVVPLEASQVALEGAASSRSHGWSLFVCHLAANTEDEDLYALFGPYAPMLSCDLVKYEGTEVCKGFAFVVLPLFSVAKRAIRELNNTLFNGDIIQVSFKKHGDGQEEWYPVIE